MIITFKLETYDDYFRDIQTYDNSLRDIYRLSFYYTQVCFLEFYNVKWLKQQGVMFEAMTMACYIVPNDYVWTMCYRVITVL